MGSIWEANGAVSQHPWSAPQPKPAEITPRGLYLLGTAPGRPVAPETRPGVLSAAETGSRAPADWGEDFCRGIKKPAEFLRRVSGSSSPRLGGAVRRVKARELARGHKLAFSLNHRGVRVERSPDPGQD
jgi:hypothetical protein